jgi:hypothetical protein
MWKGSFFFLRCGFDSNPIVGGETSTWICKFRILWFSSTDKKVYQLTLYKGIHS